MEANDAVGMTHDLAGAAAILSGLAAGLSGFWSAFGVDPLASVAAVLAPMVLIERLTVVLLSRRGHIVATILVMPMASPTFLAVAAGYAS